MLNILKGQRQLLKTYEKNKDKNKVKGRSRVFAKVIVKFRVRGKDNDRIKDPKLNLSVCKPFKYIFKYKYG